MTPWQRLKQLLRRAWPPFCENVLGGRHGRRCLLVYISEPFRRPLDARHHQNRRQVVALATLLHECGFLVDVVDWYHLGRVKLKHRYDLVIDHRPGLPTAGKLYSRAEMPGATRIAYCTTANPEWQNKAEAARLEALWCRRGVRLKPRRVAAPIDPVEFAGFHAIWLMGNSWTQQTYGPVASLPPVSLLPNTGYDLPNMRDVTRRPSAFMFLGSRGQVHKGLDLLLEVFAARPLLTLYVCSPFREESDFCRLYRRELWSTRNVRPIGFIDPTGRQFQEVASRCHYLVLPSCSEGQAGSVLTGMSGGLIPLVSRECGFDDTDVHLLPDCTLPGIAAAIDAYAAKPKAWLADESRRALERARQAHDESAYKASIRLALSRLGESPQVPVPARDVAERQ